MYRAFALLLFLSACAKTPTPKPAVRDLTHMAPAEKALQSMEGQLSFKENFVVLGKGTRLLKSFTASISGQRDHFLRGGETMIRDRVFTPKVLSSKNMKGIGVFLRGLKIVTPARPEVKGAVFLTAGAKPDQFKMGRFMRPFWRFALVLPTLPSGKPRVIREGLSWGFTVTESRTIHGRKLPIIRKFTFSITKVTHTGQLHFATVKGSSLSSSSTPVTMGQFTVEIIGRGTMEAEFSLDRGVWTHIKGRDIIGWAGTYRKTPQSAPITTGYRQELGVDIYFTENK